VSTSSAPLAVADIPAVVDRAIQNQPIVDMHTHLYPPGFGTPLPGRSGKTDPSGLMLWGVDELLTYHYLIAEVYRVVPATKLPYEQFWKMSKRQQADHIWKNLFIERAPISEACRGVLTAIKNLGLDPSDPTPDKWRNWFDQQDPSHYIDKVMEISHVSSITMTNPVFDDNERNRWLKDPKVGSDPRFKAVLRIDPLLRDWPGTAAKKLSEWGYPADTQATPKSIESAKKFLRDWLDRQKAIYIALSLPPEFRYPAEGSRGTGASPLIEGEDHGRGAHATHENEFAGRAGQDILEKAILPVCAERNLPFAMMIGSKLRVNPGLRDGGDASGKADVQSVINLCRAFPENRFFVTMLSRENQHELAVAARKFGNLMIFGCWWWLNNPSLIEEITRMRCELLGTSFIPQHSDARVLDQLLYKWDHSRRIISKVLSDKFKDQAEAGRPPTQVEIDKTVRLMLAENFEHFRKGE
jgi:hypothetical protein